MTNNAKFGVLEHGIEVHIDLNSPKIKEALSNFCINVADGNNYATMFLIGANVIAASKDKIMIVPCKKCMLEAALRFRDAAAMIEELAEGK